MTKRKAGGRFATPGTVEALTPKRPKSGLSRAATRLVERAVDEERARRGAPKTPKTPNESDFYRQFGKAAALGAMYGMPGRMIDLESLTPGRNEWPESMTAAGVRWAGARVNVERHGRLSKEQINKLVEEALRYEETRARIEQAAHEATQACMSLVQEQLLTADRKVLAMADITRLAVEGYQQVLFKAQQTMTVADERWHRSRWEDLNNRLQAFDAMYKVER